MFVRDEKNVYFPLGKGLRHVLRDLIPLGLVLLLASTTWARPPLVTAEMVEGDASVSLKLEDQFIQGDMHIPCEMIVEVLGENRPLTEGDTIEILLNEDDVPLTDIGDDTLWREDIVVDSEIVSAQRFYAVYDCSFAAVQDFFGGLEVYAKVKVNKADCNTLCEATFGEDHPATNLIRMGEMIDDASEEDDNSASAFQLPRTGVTDRVATDADWLKVTYNNPVELLARLESNFAGGDLNVTLYGSDLNVIAEGVLEANGAAKRISPNSAILPGNYFLEVIPTNPEDFNFYDLISTESQIMTDCAPGAVESRPCGRCGSEEKSCNSEGEWGNWGSCQGVGVCDPGAEESQGCGEGGSQSRTCNDMCQWDSFTACIQCDDGESEACYSGPQEFAGVGACTQGTRTCSRGQWSSCQGDTRPGVEACMDGVDNDCDGLTDSNDPECVAGLGEACMPGTCGAPFTCLPPPFSDGYCGGEECMACGVGSVCGVAFGKEYCLKPCSDFTDCRFGYTCAPVGTMGEQVCIPPCESNESCGENGVCNEQGFCETTTAEPGVVGGAVATEDEGCQQSARRGLGFYLVLMCFVSLLSRRRLNRA